MALHSLLGAAETLTYPEYSFPSWLAVAKWLWSADCAPDHLQRIDGTLVHPVNSHHDPLCWIQPGIPRPNCQQLHGKASPSPTGVYDVEHVPQSAVNLFLGASNRTDPSASTSTFM